MIRHQRQSVYKIQHAALLRVGLPTQIQYAVPLRVGLPIQYIKCNMIRFEMLKHYTTAKDWNTQSYVYSYGRVTEIKR